MEAFLATVTKVYLKSDKPLKKDTDFIKKYNGNESFDTNDIRFLGAIEFARESAIVNEGYAFPYDKNNMTYPIVGETILVIKIANDYFWQPYSNTQYPNYREDYKISEVSKEKKIDSVVGDTKNKDYKEVKDGAPNTETTKPKSAKHDYKVNEKIKFLKPREGDTIISGRVGNTIRFSEFFLTEDERIDETGNPKGGTSSPSIFIRNKQNPSIDADPIGTLAEESIDKDGSSIYITSNKVKIPFKETIKKDKKAFTEYPNSKDLKGDQVFINSDRIVLSAKSKEFIIFGKGNTGIITDGRYSVDAQKDIYLHTNSNVTIHTAGSKQIFLNSENGKIFLGKNKGAGAAGAAVQKMVLGGELVKLMGELIDAINKQIYATAVGPTATGPVNSFEFQMIKAKLNTLLSANNYLSK
jgi:hypothetical protein